MSADHAFNVAREYHRGALPGKRPGKITSTDPIVAKLFTVARRQGFYDTELAHHLGYSATAVMYWRNGRTKPSLNAMSDLADFLGYDLKLEKRQ